MSWEVQVISNLSNLDSLFILVVVILALVGRIPSSQFRIAPLPGAYLSCTFIVGANNYDIISCWFGAVYAETGPAAAFPAPCEAGEALEPTSKRPRSIMYEENASGQVSESIAREPTPGGLNQLTNLRILNLSSNQLTGEQKDTYWVAIHFLTSLKYSTPLDRLYTCHEIPTCNIVQTHLPTFVQVKSRRVWGSSSISPSFTWTTTRSVVSSVNW